jgi:hypothetical protein
MQPTYIAEPIPQPEKSLKMEVEYSAETSVYAWKNTQFSVAFSLLSGCVTDLISYPTLLNSEDIGRMFLRNVRPCNILV